MSDRPILSLKGTSVSTSESQDVVPRDLRFIERKQRYILQELIEDLSRSAASVARWRDVPLVRNP
jgi:hypothetical protein